MSDWEEYQEYRYPGRQRVPFREPLPVTGDTIVRGPRRSVERKKKNLPCYCLDRCHHQDISTAPMFRPFGWDPELDEYHILDVDQNRSRDDYRVEIVKVEEQIVRGADMVMRYGTCEASSFVKNGHTYYRLKHGDEYQVRMFNNTAEYVNALLKIDSDTMGKWRIAPYSSVTIERPSHNSRKFTFVRESSDAAREGGVRQGTESGANGLVEVTFIPMIDKRPDSMRYKSFQMPIVNTFDPSSMRDGGVRTQSYSSRITGSDMAMLNSRGLATEYAMNSIPESDSLDEESTKVLTYEAGATVLGDDSDQRFGRASRYFVEDKDRQVVKRVRLVIDNRSKYASIRDRDDGDHSGAYDDPVPPKIPFNMN